VRPIILVRRVSGSAQIRRSGKDFNLGGKKKEKTVGRDREGTVLPGRIRKNSNDEGGGS